ncbi:MAG: amidohydrolase family protein [Bacteroidota bacterium]|nr:amidohydrolase family protein [Bacteroidota bacterium]
MKSANKTQLLFLLIMLVCSLSASAQQKPIALTGATIVDVTNYGNTNHDLHNAVVIIQNGKIIKVGSKPKTKIPKGAQVIDVTGKYIVPGLIDGFTTINNQGQANAYLYMGVTTVGGGMRRDEGRGEFFYGADPSPSIKQIESIPGDIADDTLEYKEKLSPEDIHRISHELDKIDSLKSARVSTILVHHRFPVEMLNKLMRQLKKHNMSAIGELNLMPYQTAMDAGINSFVHTSRYILGAMPDSVRIPNMKTPEDTAVFKIWRSWFYNFSIDADTGFINYGKKIASSGTALMPTLSLLYSSLPNHKNLWKEPAAVLLDPKDIWLPMDTATGKSNSVISARRALRELEIEKGFAKVGAHYVTGSGADAVGAMPGISEHIEIEMLHNIGLTNRQALAAATNNFSIFYRWKEIGLIEAGRNADVLVLSTNPTEDLENLKKIEIVFLNGKRINRLQLLKK